MTSGGHKSLSQPGVVLIVAVIALDVLASVGPTLIAVADAAIPLVIAVGIVAAILRLVFFHTRKW